MDFGCLVLAAGSGERFGTEKQYHYWNGRFLWQHAYELCHSVTNEVVIVGMDIEGGSTRQESVRRGLKLIKSPRVVIVEVARPLIEKKHIMKLLAKQHSSITYGITLDEAIMTTDGDYSSSYSLLSNPQAFDTEMLKEAHEKTKIRRAPEDTMLMKEVYGVSPLIIEGDEKLHKIITRRDLDVLNVLAKR